jgi:DNA topoisomerase-3
MHADAPRVLAALGAASGGDVDAQRRHAAWNVREVTAHHAIIPTGQAIPAHLDDKAQKVYQLIRESYIRLFMPDEEFERQQATFEFHGSPNLRFKASAKQILKPGWTALGQAEADEEPDETNPALPAYRDGQAVRCDTAAVNALQTRPPKPYTDKTLIAAMIGIHKLVTDPKLKSRLKETSGLGTEATRAAMIETLIERDYIVRQGKDLLPTDRGAKLIGILRASYPSIADPGETAVQEDALADIASGQLAFDQFMTTVLAKTGEATKALLNQAAVDGGQETCPACAQRACVPLRGKAGRAYWKCRACAAAFGDGGGKPGQAFEPRGQGEAPRPEAGPPCPACRQKTGQYLTRNEKPYFRCAQCGASYWPDFKDQARIGKAWAARK